MVAGVDTLVTERSTWRSTDGGPLHGGAAGLVLVVLDQDLAIDVTRPGARPALLLFERDQQERRGGERISRRFGLELAGRTRGARAVLRRANAERATE